MVYVVYIEKFYNVGSVNEFKEFEIYSVCSSMKKAEKEMNYCYSNEDLDEFDNVYISSDYQVLD